MTSVDNMKRFLRSYTSVINEPVKLRVYDVGKDPRISQANGVLRIFGTGAYHCAIEIYDMEWSFGWTNAGTGVFWCQPGKCNMHQYREAIDLGNANFTREQVEDLLDEL